MGLIEFIVLLVVAAIAGALGQYLGGYKKGGFFFAVILGFIGAFVGINLANILGLPPIFTIDIGGVTFPIVWAIIGAALLVALIGLLGRGRGFGWRVSPPTQVVLGLSLLFALLALLTFLSIIALPISTTGLLAAAYVTLLLGTLVRGL